MFSERDVWVQHVRRQELEEAAQGYRFAKQFNIPDPASTSVFRPLINKVGQFLVKLGGCLQGHHTDSNCLQPPDQKLSGQIH
ncbi:MAG: hypothetical protein KAT29_08450 [Anaerolineales bacterium]|nr:hypothetical protein [Anaerolineales bacterium]